jgi:integrase
MKVPKPRKLPSGAWFIQLRLGGESIPITAHTEKECVKQAEYVKAEHRAGRRTKPASKEKMPEKTLRDACTEYIERQRSRLEESTIQGYEKIRNRYFQGIMDKSLTELTYDVLDKEIGVECARVSKRGKPLAPKTVRNNFMFLISVLKKQKIRFDDEFSLPELKKKPVKIIPAEDVYSAVKGTPIELPCLLAMWLTMSISEIRGLTKSKSIANGQITIVETVVDIKGKPVRKEGGKEEERTRTQDIPPYIQRLIDQVDGDVLCPLSSQATNKRLQRLLEKKGLPVISFHKLRHISASTMALLKIPTNYAQEKGGWKTDYIMRTVYTHTFTEERKRADEKMDGFFKEIVDKNANENANKQ